jgi:hypothetical protein
VSDAAGLLGPVGAAALDEARKVLRTAAAGRGPATVRVAGWTHADWAVRFELADGGSHVVVHVPHDGSPIAIREAGPGSDPLTPDARA